MSPVALRPVHKASVVDGTWQILCEPEKWTAFQTTRYNGQVTCPECLRLLREHVAQLSRELKP